MATVEAVWELSDEANWTSVPLAEGHKPSSCPQQPLSICKGTETPMSRVQGKGLILMKLFRDVRHGLFLWNLQTQIIIKVQIFVGIE